MTKSNEPTTTKLRCSCGHLMNETWAYPKWYRYAVPAWKCPGCGALWIDETMKPKGKKK